MISLVAAAAFAGVAVLLALARRSPGASVVRLSMRNALLAGVGVAAAVALVRTAPDLLATYRYIGGLFLIATAVISVRRATAAIVDSELNGDRREAWLAPADTVELVFYASLATHFIETSDPSWLMPFVLMAAVAALLLPGIGSIDALVTGTADPTTVGRRVRQTAGLLLLLIGIYLAWP